jgi:hypothetical protein
MSRIAALGLWFLASTTAQAVMPPCFAADRGPAWVRHTIDNSSRGADGVRLADVNADRLPDIITGWEQGGLVRVYQNPGTKAARRPWPAVTIGKVAAPEDAVLADLDGDGRLDAVSCCEGRTNTMFLHWAPQRGEYLQSAAWQTEPLPASQGATSWMFCLPQQVDGRHGLDLVAGSKAKDACIGWFQAPADPRNAAAWTWHKLYQAGWIMSLVAADLDGDGDQDILATDRKGPDRGCLWLENPGPAAAAGAWKQHRIGGGQREVMFLDYADLDRDGLLDVLVATRDGGVLWHRRPSRDASQWETTEIRMPENTGTGKAVRAGDLDLDGRLDLVVSCENAQGAKSGCFWISSGGSPAEPDWTAHEISGPEGVKYDLLELLDLDGDGDLDVLTCEEAANLGVFWYENPTRP